MNKYLSRTLVLASCLLFVGQGCVSVSGSNQQATAGPSGVFLSTNRGDSWSSISVLPEADGVKNISSVSTFVLKQDPSDSKAIYWGSRAHGMFYSFDAGSSWNRASEPANGGFVYDVSVNPNDTCSILVAKGSEILRSTDCNRKFEPIFREAGADKIVSVSFDPFTAGKMYVGKRGGDLLVSEDSGISWEVMNRFERAKIVDVVADPNDEGVIYVSTLNQGLFRTDDGGETWLDLAAGIREFTKAVNYKDFEVYQAESGVLYWVSDYGILRSENRGDSWEEIPSIPSPGSVDIYAFAVNPKNEKEIYYTGTVGTRSTLYRSVDGGKTWLTKKLPTGQLPTELLVHPENDGWVYIGFTIPPKS